jgi:hypothetical protein
MLLRRTHFLGAAAVSLGVLIPAGAAAVPCSSLGLPNPIYGSGGSAITNTLRAVAVELAKLPEDERVTIFFADPGACSGYQAFLDENVKTQFKYWSADNVQGTCDAEDLVNGQAVDFAHMGNAADFCIGGTQPDTVSDTLGPVQTVNLITNRSSVEDSISAEAVFLAYGFGAASAAGPWTIEAGLQKRKSDSFVHLFLADSVTLPPSAFLGVERGNNQDVVKFVGEFATPDASLGYVSSSAAELGKATVKTLAYQHFGQTCGVYPDSTASRYDKLNVRQGKYHFWTPGHFFARQDPATGAFTNANAEKLIGWFTGKVAPPGELDVNALIIGAGDTPQCAMQVKREGTVGAISSFAPDKPCGCYFETIALKEIPESCEACETDDDCGGDTPSCNYGFCEAYRAEGEVEG